MQRIGGYPRLWHREGWHLDLASPISDEQVANFEARWRPFRVEWLRSPGGHLDHALPQTLERQVRNTNARSTIERGRGQY